MMGMLNNLQNSEYVDHDSDDNDSDDKTDEIMIINSDDNDSDDNDSDKYIVTYHDHKPEISKEHVSHLKKTFCDFLCCCLHLQCQEQTILLLVFSK